MIENGTKELIAIFGIFFYVVISVILAFSAILMLLGMGIADIISLLFWGYLFGAGILIVMATIRIIRYFNGTL